MVRRFKIWIEHFLTSISHANIAVSESNRASGKQQINSFKAVVINNGIDQQKFDPEQKFKDIRHELKVDPTKILIAFIARFTAHKQPLSLLKAFAIACKENSSLQLLMVGEGDEREHAYEFVEKMNIKDRVHFLPFRQDVPDLLAASDIFVLPSLWEGLPIGLLEAMSMCKAVIATNVDGTKEIVKNGYNGLLIETDNLVENIAKAILTLSKDKLLRDQLSANAISTVRVAYDAAVMTRKTEQVYFRIVTKVKAQETKTVSMFPVSTIS